MAWLLARPQGGSEPDALAWLDSRDLRGQIANQIGPALRSIWAEAYRAGVQAAGGQVDEQVLQDLLSQFATDWADQIVSTRMRKLAGLLAQGLDAKQLEAAISELLADPVQSELIARTEVARAFNFGVAAAYRAAGIHLVEWLTANDGQVCPVCMSNQDAGPHPYGTPFPSGALQPPEHPRCRCVLIPATERNG